MLPESYLPSPKTQDLDEKAALIQENMDLKRRLEHLMNPVFMPRNEEEVMRNMLALGEQLKYIDDIPQLTITFDEQTHSSLFFTVILVYVIYEGFFRLEYFIKNHKSEFTYLYEGTKSLGPLRNKYSKEAVIFRVQLPKENFLRSDYSIDLYKARQAVFNDVSRVTDKELRDFNGGMISRQNEFLNSFKNLMGHECNEILLENFFYSLMPAVMRTMLEPETLRTLFLMQVGMIETEFFRGEKYLMRIKCDAEFVYVMIKAQDRTVKETLSKIFIQLHVPSSDLVNSHVKIDDIPYVGYIYRCDEEEMQRQFCHMMYNAVLTWDTIYNHRKYTNREALKTSNTGILTG